MAAKSLNKKLIKMLGEAIEESGSIQLARDYVKIPRSTYYFWKKQAEEIEENNPERENLTKDEDLLLEFLDTIEFSRHKPGKKLLSAAWKAVERGDSRIILHMMKSLFRDEFNPTPSTFRLETTQNDGDSGTGIALIPVMPENTNLEEMLKQQQKGVQKLAQDKTKDIQNGHG